MKQYICTVIKDNVACFQPIIECVTKNKENLIFISDKEKQYLDITEDDNVTIGCIKTISMSLC